MKRYISRLAILSGCALVLASCSENAWNDKLDGFEDESGKLDNVQALDITLTPNDYKLLSDNSTNKALAGDANANALKAVASQCYLTDVITAEEYVPALLSDTKFRYFTLDDGSSINVTYNFGENIPSHVSEMAAAQQYVVSDEDYQNVWGSENDYTASFAPSHTAAKSIPRLLKTAYPDAQANDYVIVNYNTSLVDPVFSAAPEPEVPAFPLSNVLSSISKGSDIDVNGVVMATSTQGPIVADASGSVFVYLPTNNNDLKIGDQLVFNATVDSYNYGFQITKGTETEIKGSQAVTYPTAKTWTGAEIDQFVADAMASGATPISPVYSTFKGTAVVGKYINIKLDGTTVQLSPYGASDNIKAMITDGAEVTIEGYVMAIASKGLYLNTIVTKVNGKSVNAAAKAPASRAVNVASTNENAIYCFNGSNWSAAENTVVLSHADYQAMGQRYDNLQDDGPETYLPTFMKQKFPYAQPEDVKYVVYYYYSNSTTSTRCEQYVFNGSEWKVGNLITERTLQFVKSNGKWNYDPSVVVTLPGGKGIAISALYYQTCVDWVKNNVPDGAAYVSSYGNNEYYCGTSAYQGNVDLRASAAKTQYAGYSDMTDEEVVALEKERFETEVMPAALGILHPNMAPVPGIDVTLTLNFAWYDGTTHQATAIFNVVAKGKFEFASCTWNEE